MPLTIINSSMLDNRKQLPRYPRPSSDKDKWRGWRSQNVGAPACSKEGQRFSASCEQRFEQSERIRPGHSA